ncbi:MAG: hypothetical protein HWQ35_02755 [Nostoc sp. NMS1]|uniref:hypothetical protein n=1 Tax=unclassified Nostoc TaxID=2593658 RepID=UPI0025DD0DEF|nr:MULTISPECIES: hypothetical protein [unclassified Nostoc]MBN3905526.1 hypothetical protein [Nostoc sp. NMS1]MBN3994069.1 hypothetical protein [Nostoc sp. NMS2]
MEQLTNAAFLTSVVMSAMGYAYAIHIIFTRKMFRVSLQVGRAAQSAALSLHHYQQIGSVLKPGINLS